MVLDFGPPTIRAARRRSTLVLSTRPPPRCADAVAPAHARHARRARAASTIGSPRWRRRPTGVTRERSSRQPASRSTDGGTGSGSTPRPGGGCSRRSGNVGALTHDARFAKQIVPFGPTPARPYSVAVKAGGFIYLSGTLAEDARSTPAAGIAARRAACSSGCASVLHAAGSSLEQVVSVTVYLTSAADFQAMNQAYRAFWPGDPPTRTTVITALVVPDAAIEISMMAVPRGGERIVLPQGWKPSPNPYSYAIRSGDTLFLSGLVPRRGATTRSCPATSRPRPARSWTTRGQLLAAAGMTFRNVVSARVYLTSRRTSRR